MNLLLTVVGDVGRSYQVGSSLGAGPFPLAGRTIGLTVDGLLLVSTAVGLIFPLVIRELLDAAFLAGSERLLNTVAIGLLALFALQAIVNFGQSYLTASVSERVVADLRKDLFGNLVHQDYPVGRGKLITENFDVAPGCHDGRMLCSQRATDPGQFSLGQAQILLQGLTAPIIGVQPRAAARGEATLEFHAPVAHLCQLLGLAAQQL